MPFTTEQLVKLINAAQSQLVKDMREIARRIESLPPQYDDSEIRKAIASLADSIPEIPPGYDDTALREEIARVAKSIPEIPAAYDDSELRTLIEDVSKSIPMVPEIPAAYDDSELRTLIEDVSKSIPTVPDIPPQYDDSELRSLIAELTKSIPTVPEIPPKYDDSDIRKDLGALEVSILELTDHLQKYAKTHETKIKQVEQFAKEAARDIVQEQLRINAQPTEPWIKGIDYPAGRKVTHHGGTWEAVKPCAAEPGRSAAWLLLSDGIKTILADGHSLKIITTSGTIHEVKGLKGEAGTSINFRGKWLEDYPYLVNEIAVTDGAAWISLEDDNKDQPPSKKWGCIAQRGPRGRQGDKGVKPDATDIYPLLMDVFNQHYQKLASKVAEDARIPATPEEVEPVAKTAIEAMLPAYHAALRKDLNSHIQKRFEEINRQKLPGSHDAPSQPDGGDKG